MQTCICAVRLWDGAVSRRAICRIVVGVGDGLVWGSGNGMIIALTNVDAGEIAKR